MANEALDEQAATDARAERLRYAAALAALQTDDADGFVAEFRQHREAMSVIMRRLTARRAGLPPEHVNDPRD